MINPVDLQLAGSASFGLVVGWITYRTLRRRSGEVGLADIGIVLSAIGGGAVTAIFQDATLFAGYSLGLAAGFFGYLVVAAIVERAWARRKAPATVPVAAAPAAPEKDERASLPEWMK